jgi:hypothetical protein
MPERHSAMMAESTDKCNGLIDTVDGNIKKNGMGPVH